MSVHRANFSIIEPHLPLRNLIKSRNKERLGFRYGVFMSLEFNIGILSHEGWCGTTRVYFYHALLNSRLRHTHTLKLM